MKTLYLDGRESLAVRLDGPTLRVSAPERADRLFPLRRVGRVVVRGQVEWSSEALLACADRDVFVTFLTGEGAFRARLSGRRPKGRPLLDLGEALEAWLEDAGGAERLRTWLDAEAQHARLRLSRQLYGAPISSLAGELRNRIRDQALRYVSEQDRERLDRELAGLLASHLETLLTRVGIRPDDALLAVHGIDVSRAAADVLTWSLQIDKLRFLWRRQRIAERRGARLGTAPRHAVVDFYEAHRETVEEAFRLTVARLHRYPIENLDHHADR